jgi:hypothetical protein
MKEMYRCMNYCVKTPNRGKTLKPNAVWDGSRDFLFEVSGNSDSDFAKDPLTRRSVSGNSTFLNGAPVTEKSKMQNCVTLSVTEAEAVSAVMCAQDMLFVYHVLKSIGLKVKLPMVLRLDNKGAFDLFNNWGVAGRTRHISVRLYFMRELKEQGILTTEWTGGDLNPSDLFTKNLGNPAFHRNTAVYTGIDEYMTAEDEEAKIKQYLEMLQGESVRGGPGWAGGSAIGARPGSPYHPNRNKNPNENTEQSANEQSLQQG